MEVAVLCDRQLEVASFTDKRNKKRDLFTKHWFANELKYDHLNAVNNNLGDTWKKFLIKVVI
jgi:hypothetical protein